MRTICLLTLLMLPILSPAGSIWDRRDRRASRLFDDNNARQIGDVLTVEINETTAANETEKRDLSKSNGAGGALSVDAKPGSGTGAKFDLNMNNSSNRNFSGSAQLSSDRKFADRITVTVVDVQPNGNLVIEGFRSRIVAGERRELRITGIVRPADIGAQNTVESRFVANFRVSYLGHGPESKFVNQGWFSKMWNHIWPF
jgi:flagellar L-ring protein precursor FlgH